MDTIRKAAIVSGIVAACILLTTPAMAGWQLCVTAEEYDHLLSQNIEMTDLNGNYKAGSVGEITGVLRKEHPNFDGAACDESEATAFYAASVHGELHVGSTSISTPKSLARTGAKTWTWTWQAESGKSASDYLWNYKLKGVASADAQIKLDTAGGYGKAKAEAWVKLIGDGANTSPQSASVSVAAGGEVRESGFAFTGAGFSIGADSIGLSLSWEPAGTQLYAGGSELKYVSIAEIIRPGSMCWLIVDTAATGHLYSFHDTYRYSNDVSSSAGIVYPNSMTVINPPTYSPE